MICLLGFPKARFESIEEANHGKGPWFAYVCMVGGLKGDLTVGWKLDL